MIPKVRNCDTKPSISDSITNYLPAIQAKIKAVEKEFNLVLISENFTESMVLLKDLLHWTAEDMTWTVKNHGSNIKSSISQNAYRCLEEWNKADMILYQHFKQKFEQIVMVFGVNEMEKKSKELLMLNSNIMEKCQSKQDVGDISSWPSEYQCKLFFLPEMKFLDLARNRQRDRAKVLLGKCCD